MRVKNKSGSGHGIRSDSPTPRRSFGLRITEPGPSKLLESAQLDQDEAKSGGRMNGEGEHDPFGTFPEVDQPADVHFGELIEHVIGINSDGRDEFIGRTPGCFAIDDRIDDPGPYLGNLVVSLGFVAHGVRSAR